MSMLIFGQTLFGLQYGPGTPFYVTQQYID